MTHPSLTQPRPHTLPGCLELASHSDAGVVFESTVGKLSDLRYAKLLGRAKDYAAYLEAQGVAQGHVVALVLPTGPGFYDAFFGALFLGAIPAPLYPPMRFGRLEPYLVQTRAALSTIQASWVVTDPRLRSTLAVAVSHGSCVQKVLAFKEGHVADSAQKNHLWHQGNSDDVALIQFSSGTTGQPKAIHLTHRQLLANIDSFTAALEPALPLHGRHSCVSWLPLYHDMGLVGCMLAAVREAADLTLLPPEAFVTQPARWLQAMTRTKATVSAAPNFAYALCTERIADDVLPHLDLSCWRVALNGAEPVVPETMEDFQKRFTPCGLSPTALTPVYGLAEAALAVTFSAVDRPYTTRTYARCSLAPNTQPRAPAPGEKSQILASLGLPLNGYQVRVVSADIPGNTLSPGLVGLIEVRGPSVSITTTINATVQERSPWLRTGDLGFMADGELFLWGRQKDTIIVRGRNFAPQDIEACVYALDFVRTGCVVAASLLLEGQSSESLIVLYENRNKTPGCHQKQAQQDHQVAQAISREFGLVPAYTVALAPGTLMRTSSGKLKRKASSQAWANGCLHPPKSTGALSVITQLLRSWLKFAWSAYRPSTQRPDHL